MTDRCEKRQAAILPCLVQHQRETSPEFAEWMEPMKNIGIKSSLLFLFGIAIGVLAKWGDIIPGMNPIHFLGLISSGIVIWLAIGTLLMIESKSRVEFNVLYSVFMLAMLTSYYLFSAAFAEFLNTRVMLFWFAMFACSVVLGNVLFHKRNTKSCLVLYAMAALCFLVLDAVWINGIQLQAVIPEVLLSIGILIRINQKGNKGEF